MTDDQANPLYELDGAFCTLLGGSPSGLWNALQGAEPGDRLVDLVRRRFRGPVRPRLCLVQDEPGRPSFRCAAAVLVARALAARGLRVALVDGDDRQPDLSLWAGRLETEGWIDMARYGVSAERASTPLAAERGSVRLYGVGSYHPVRLEPGELDGLLERLQEAADVVVVALPLGPDGDPWLRFPAVRLLCWDRRDQAPERIETILERLAGQDAEPDQILTCGTAAPSREKRPGASSPVFRRMALLLSLLVVLVAVWWFAVIREVPANGELVGTSQPPTAEVDSAAAHGTAPAPAETAAVAVQTALDTLVSTPTAAEPGPDSAERAVERPEPEPELPAETAAEPAPTPDPASDDPFAREVGSEGWALHVYTFRSVELAEVELERMARKGVIGIHHQETVPDGRLLIRIYTGSFPTRAAARDALPELLERLGTDWAQPARASRFRTAE